MNEPTFTILGKMKQTVNTKKTLGRVWFRYFQLYGMTDKLTAACAKIGWTHTDRKICERTLSFGKSVYSKYSERWCTGCTTTGRFEMVVEPS